MACLLYTALFTLLMPLILLRLLYRGWRAAGYRRRVSERFGHFTPPATRGGIWVHAVSVGETIAAAPMIQALQARYPGRPMTVTTMTPTGSERVKALFGDDVFHVYAPYDLPLLVDAFLDRVQPRLLIIMETELWPNTLRCCRRRGIPAVLANARLSAKSAAGYQRLLPLTGPMLRDLQQVVAQTEADAARFQALGLAREQLQVSGSIKFDISIDAAVCQQRDALAQRLTAPGRTVLVAASTHEDEEATLLDSLLPLREAFPALLLILVPRHPERFDRVARLVEQAGATLQRRSTMDRLAPDTAVVLADSMGELLALYGVADLAFVGGSLVPRGGHNMLEPAAWGVPIITGDSDFNFAAISAALVQAGGLVKVGDSNALQTACRHWLANPAARTEAGAAARAVVEANRGALQRLLQAIESVDPGEE